MFEHILLAVDGSEYSQKAVQTAVGLARALGSEVVVLHVREQDVGRAAAMPLETAEDSTDLVKDTVAELTKAGVTAHADVHVALVGHTARDIVDTARSHGSDVIVMGSRGLSDIGGLLLGSVTHKVIQLAELPVLVAR